MGGCRCSYKNCTNTTKTRDNLHFFHYPVKQKERCKAWIENANKPQFYDLDEDQLRNKVICETHFQECFFPNSQKKRLLQGAVPTLDGDCVQEPSPITRRTLKVQDVQVLPANDDGTIFVLETDNFRTNFESERIESYIYTNNGLVLPISKSNETTDDNVQVYSAGEMEELYEPPSNHRMKREPPVLRIRKNLNSCENVIPDKDVEPESNTTQGTQKRVFHTPIAVNDDVVTRTLGSKYINKINQHSKDISILKRLLKTRTVPHRKISNTVVLNNLKRQIPSTLFNVVNYNINPNNCTFSTQDLDFFTTIYNTSPDVYQILGDKYNWTLPSPECLVTTKNNGRVYSNNDK